MNDFFGKYQSLVVQGWVGMLFLLLTMFITDLVELGMQGDYAATSVFLLKDPGVAGLWFLAGLICLNVIAQMGIRAVSEKRCRWWVFGVTVGYGCFFLAHQVMHLAAGEGLDIHFLLDTTHNVIAAWASWAAYQWASLKNSAYPIEHYTAVHQH